MAPKIFISYSREDKDKVFPFIEQINKVFDNVCWIDLDGIESGEQFENVIFNAIDNCEIVLFMLSDNSLKSKWTKREVYYAEDGGKRIIPVLVDGDNLRGWFKFHFGNVDYINIDDANQKDKLIRYLKSHIVGADYSETDVLEMSKSDDYPIIDELGRVVRCKYGKNATIAYSSSRIIASSTPSFLTALAAPFLIIAAPITLVASGINYAVRAVKGHKRSTRQYGISYLPTYNTFDTDLTYSSIYAPAEVKPKSRMQVQVYLHLFEETERVNNLAKESDKDAERRDYIPLQCKLKKGDKVDVLLSIYGEILLMSDKKSVIWQDSFTKCSFDYFVPRDIDVDELSCVALLTVNEIPVGEMRFITKIVESPRKLNPEIIAHKYNKVFISYAHKDEAKVKSFHEGLKVAGIEHFFDRTYLKTGDIFPQVIRDYINSADLFVLFWSENASKSEYVEKERTQALERAFPQVKPQQAAKLSIYPMSIEPRAELPSDMKDNYHFGEI